jgi:NTP pyrophosphatase (non-canonical NTP hydrolase)
LGRAFCWLAQVIYVFSLLVRAMDVSEISKKIYEFVEKRVSDLGSELTPELMFIHLSEEIGEIARQLVNKNLPMRKYREDNLKEEIAQAILDLFVLSGIFEIDLPKEIDKKIDTWQRGDNSSWLIKPV